MSTLGQRLARLRVDTTPLRESRDFRLLFWAGTVFYLGAMVSYVALPFQIYQLTGSNLAVGALGIVELVPLVVFGLYGGALADHVDRRTMLVVTGVVQVLLTALLTVNAFLSTPRIWAIYVLGALLSAAGSMQRPSREALLPRVVRLRYAAGRKDLLGTYLIDIMAMFMAMPIVLFPALATQVFNAPAMLGLLYSAESVGALIATATSGWTARVHHHGRAVVIAASAWGASIALAGLMPTMWLVLVALLAAGAADMVSGLFRSIIWNQTIPDSMRGQLAGIEMLSYSLGPLGGQARAGLVADRWSVRGSITSGGILCVLGVALTTSWLRGFWAYDERTDEHAVRERGIRAEQGEQAG